MGRAFYTTAVKRVSPIYECIVVGLGAAGSAALYHLAKRGVKALGLEAQAFVGHPMGSSHGQSRILRLVYHEEEGRGGYTSLLRRAYELWHRLESEAQNLAQGMERVPLFRQTGCLNISCPTAEAAGSDGHSCYSGAKASAEKYKLQHETMDANQLNQRFPAYSLSPGCKALYDPAGGVLLPEAALNTFIDLAKGSGAEVEMNSPVLEWEKVEGEGAGSCYRVHTPLETHFARKLIFAAGSWMPTMVPHIAQYLCVERQVVGWFEVPDRDAHFSPERFPVFVLDDKDAYYYGFPMDEDGCVKLGKYHHLGQQVSSMTAVDRVVYADDERALRQCLIDHFPRLKDAPMKKSSVCLFTNTVDGHFILDHHPHYSSDVVIASACSGHGFKFAPVVGEILADLAMQGTSYSSHDIDMFRLANRPTFDTS